ncbi:hypothetical protein K435DRAFT_849420 [Dendrothele bispora CBS 962.96]|uniref:Uncharacterized protein n=1 Tax=Dendrothele bispora (strain CBS 962.96) TaxID=1314807 RepID=A0A4S8MS37_DENBC|nr:hypothetical protein K435DRAFT_849420 [Dendrothele bispora CBS 962.96]
MLKRQRPASPKPSSSNTPLLTDSSVLELPNAKRRRTFPPVLDGKLRGWATAPNEAGADPEGYQDEEYFDEEQDSRYLVPLREVDSPYKSANNLLHELHTLHKHRLLFAHHTSQSSRSHPYSTDNPYSTESYIDNIPESQSTYHDGNKDVSGRLHLQGLDRSQLGIQQEESQCVRTRYEDTNKLLGSLFLSRRRQLDGADGIPVADT